MIARRRSSTRFALRIALGLAAAILASCGVARAQVPFEVLHAFAGRTAPRYPSSYFGGFIPAADGSLYGVTSEGGSFDLGTVYRMAPDGTLLVLRSFSPGEGGGYNAQLIQATNGNFFGTTGSSFFTMTPDGTFTVLHAFSRASGEHSPFRFVQGRWKLLRD